MSEDRAPAPWAVLLVRCSVLALHNAMRIYGTFLDRGLGFGAIWSVATALGLLRVLAVLGLRETARR